MKGWYWILLGLIVFAFAGGAALSPPSGSTPPDIVHLFAEAIASAEGFFIAGSRAQRNNNPGNIRNAGQFIVYPTVTDGWNALYHQVSLMFYGGSAFYNASMSIEQVGFIYADGANDPTGAANWAHNVAGYLGVPIMTTLSELIPV